MVAFAKLQELIQGRPITYPGQQVVNALAVRGDRRAPASRSSRAPSSSGCSRCVIAGALVFGVLFVLPIGGADMPVVISLLNAFTGLAAAATGFELENERADRQRHARRRVGNAADDDDGPGDEPLDRERALRRVRAGAGRRRATARATSGTVRSATAEDVAIMLAYAQQGRRRAGLRDGGRAGAARRARARRRAREEGRRGRRTRSIRSPAACRAT